MGTITSNRQLAKYSYLITMNTTVILLSSLIMSCLCTPKNDLTCSICVDVVTDIDNFITSDTTEQEIVDFVKEICLSLGSLLPPDLHLDIFCINLVEEQLPSIIEGLVDDNLNPQEVCQSIPLVLEGDSCTF